MEYNASERELLLGCAKDSIGYGLVHHSIMKLEVDQYPSHLREIRASFVTLHIDKRLRGCIGTLFANLPLIIDINNNAFNAAFHDPRFPALTIQEFDNILLDISVLSKPTPLNVNSEDDLLSKLQPGVDGLILTDGNHRATFLPSVWEQLPNPKDFVIHLKNKAGWPSNYWSDSIVVETYTAELIS